jgi:hypothetical protein
VPRASPRGGFVTSSATGGNRVGDRALVSVVGGVFRTSLVIAASIVPQRPRWSVLTDAKRVDSLHGRPAPTRRARFRSRVRPGFSFERYLFAICRRHEIRSRCGVVGPFPHRNGIVAKSPFGIDVRHNDRAMEGLPIFP